MTSHNIEIEDAAEEIEEVVPVKRMTRKIVYIGNGAFLMGVPARNLSIKEYDALPAHTRKALLDQGIMEIIKE